MQGELPLQLTCPQSPPRTAASSGLPSSHLQQHSTHQERADRGSQHDHRSRHTPAPLDTSPGLSTAPEEPPARHHRAVGAEETPPEHRQGWGAQTLPAWRCCRSPETPTGSSLALSLMLKHHLSDSLYNHYTRPQTLSRSTNAGGVVLNCRLHSNL